MDVWPAGDYSEYLPRGTIQERLRGHWLATGAYVRTAIERKATTGKVVKVRLGSRMCEEASAHDD